MLTADTVVSLSHTTSAVFTTCSWRDVEEKEILDVPQSMRNKSLLSFIYIDKLFDFMHMNLIICIGLYAYAIHNMHIYLIICICMFLFAYACFYLHMHIFICIFIIMCICSICNVTTLSWLSIILKLNSVLFFFEIS